MLHSNYNQETELSLSSIEIDSFFIPNNVNKKLLEHWDESVLKHKKDFSIGKKAAMVHEGFLANVGPEVSELLHYEMNRLFSALAIVSPGILASIRLKCKYLSYKGAMKIRTFKHREEAIKWLETLTNSNKVIH